MADNIVATNFTTKILKKELQVAKNINSPIEVIYVDGSYPNGDWLGIVATAVSQDDQFQITIKPSENNDGYSVQGLLDEIVNENLPVSICFCNNTLSNNITFHKFNYSENLTTLFLL